jgi:hypothetical protein
MYVGGQDFWSRSGQRCINSGMKAREIIDADAWLARKKERRAETISDERRQLMAMIYDDTARNLAELEVERAELELEQVKADTLKAKADAAKSIAKAKQDLR